MNCLTSSLKNVTAAAALLGAVSLSGGVAMAEDAISVWSWDPNFNGAVLKTSLEHFQKTHPDASLDLIDFGKDALEQKLQAQLASGSTQGLPDMVLLEDYAAQRFLLSFPNAFDPIGNHVDLSNMASYKTAVSTVDGTIYSMPFDSGVTGFYYHKADLEAAGFTADDLKDITWDRLIEIGKAVEEKTGKKLLVQNFNATDIMRTMMQSVGIWWITPEFEVTAEVDPRFEQVTRAYINLLQSGIVQDAAGWDTYVRGFTNHEVTGVISGAWMTAGIKANPDQAGEWAVAPIPRLEGVEGATNASNVGGSSWYLLNDAPNKDLTIEYLKEVWGKDVGFYEQILVNQGAIGSLVTAFDSDAYKQPDEFFGGQTVWADFGDWLTKVPEVNYGIFSAEADAAFISTFPEVARGNMSFEDAMAGYIARVKPQIQ